MKILFLQFWYDLYGGIETVNDTLASQFSKDGYDVTVLCLWSKRQKEYIYSNEYKKEVIADEPTRASYKKMLKKMKKLDFSDFTAKIKKSLKYYYLKHLNKKEYQKRIKELQPDFIIVSNPMIIKLVPKKMLKKTILHLHYSIDIFSRIEKKITNTTKKFNNKVKKIVVLTPNFVKEAKKINITNVTYMDNPVRIKSNNNNKLDQKKITYIGRLAPEKRVDKLVEIFNESSLQKKGWHLNIYGTGNINKLDVQKNVHVKGGTNNVKEVLEQTSILALTSKYEGFPMVVLEAYECGVPVIMYDYGVSSSEILIDGQTGFIIAMDNKKEYIMKLKKMCESNELRKKMGDNAKNVVKKYYPENVAKRWYKLFEGEL